MTRHIMKKNNSDKNLPSKQMGNKDRYKYYLEIIKNFINRHNIIKFILYLQGNFLILYLCMRVSKLNMKYFNFTVCF